MLVSRQGGLHHRHDSAFSIRCVANAETDDSRAGLAELLGLFQVAPLDVETR
jgi:hypothetical protein